MKKVIKKTKKVVKKVKEVLPELCGTCSGTGRTGPVTSCPVCLGTGKYK